MVKVIESLGRRLLHCLPAEVSHVLGLESLNWVNRLGAMSLMASSPIKQPTNCMGLTFPNPVGLAAGLDKNGDYIDALGALGFGFIEIGTITPKPQPGNPKPRLFRLSEEQAIINRMGFNNLGVDHLVGKVKKSRFKSDGGILGINIGKNLTTPVENAVEDYLFCLDRVYEWSDYIVVNISSPNTPGLRSLQYGEALSALLQPIKERQLQLESRHGQYVPLVVKVAPDMSGEEAQAVAEQLLSHEIDGITATNTTASRGGVAESPYASEQGGLSGAPLTNLSLQTLEHIAPMVDGKMALIGVGGIMSGEDAAAKWRAGAELVQLYTGFIYRGSELIQECVSHYESVKNIEAGKAA